MRDNFRTRNYFEEYLKKEDKNIEEFSKILLQLEKENQDGIRRCKMFLSNNLRHKILGLYSGGYELTKINAVFNRYVEYSEAYMDEGASFYKVLEISSLAVLLEAKKDTVDIIKRITLNTKMNDKLIDMFINHLDEKWDIAHNISRSNMFSVCIDNEDNNTILCIKKYLNEKWYDGHIDADWYDSHRSKSNTYCGYWSFESGAIVKILGLDDTILKDVPYYPYDLVHYKDDK